MCSFASLLCICSFVLALAWLYCLHMVLSRGLALGLLAGGAGEVSLLQPLFLQHGMSDCIPLICRENQIPQGDPQSHTAGLSFRSMCPIFGPITCFWISKELCSLQPPLCIRRLSLLFLPPAPVHAARCPHLDAQQQPARGIRKSPCSKHPLLSGGRGERQGLCKDSDCLSEGRVYPKAVCFCLQHAASPSFFLALLPDIPVSVRKHSSCSTM